MRSRLLTLLSLFVLLLQPITLLHGLAHQNGVPPSAAPGWHSTAVASADVSAPADDSVCPLCLALGALGLGVLPALVRVAAVRLAHAAPPTPAVPLHGGTAAGYHARGPPAPALTA